MRFPLDANILSAYLRGDGRIFNLFVQHGGGLCTSAVCAGELYSWVYRARTNPGHLTALQNLLNDVQILAVDHEVARKFGQVRAALLDLGRPTPAADLLIACAALTYDLTLVTHNVHDFAHIPNMHVEDWLG